jgi:hypothetical protein
MASTALPHYEISSSRNSFCRNNKTRNSRSIASSDKVDSWTLANIGQTSTNVVPVGSHWSATIMSSRERVSLIEKGSWDIRYTSNETNGSFTALDMNSGA